MLDVRQLVKGVISPPFENPLIESKLSPSEGLIIKHFSGDNKPEKRKKYLKNYMKAYFKDKKRKELIFTKKEYTFLHNKAKEHKQNVGFFARHCIFAYLDKIYIAPNTDVLNKLLLSIRIIGNNINQIAKHTNKVKSLSLFNAKRLHDRLNALEVTIEQSICDPPGLLHLVTKSIANKPDLIYQLELILYYEKIKHKN